MHINVVRSGKMNQYTRLLLRRSVRQGPRVRKLTLANLTGWSAESIRELETMLEMRRQAHTADARNEADKKIFATLINRGCPVWKLIQQLPA